MPVPTEDRYELRIALVNEDTDTMFSEWSEPIEGHLLNEDGTPDFGAIFRLGRREYGRCQSKVYVGEGRPVGWCFVKRDRYQDTDESYLRSAWVTVERLVQPARPAEYEAVTVGSAR